MFFSAGSSVWLVIFMALVTAMLHVGVVAMERGGGDGWSLLFALITLLALLTSILSQASDIVILIAGLVTAMLFFGIRHTKKVMRRQQP